MVKKLNNYKKFIFKNSSFCYSYPNFYLTSLLGTKQINLYNFFSNSVNFKNFFGSNSFEINYLDDKINFINLYKNILNLYKLLNVGCFVNLKIMGLGFKLRRLGNHFCRIFLGQSHFFYLEYPSNILIKAQKKSLLIFGNNAKMVGEIASQVLLLRKLNRYKVTGVLKPTNIVLLKAGKQR